MGAAKVETGQRRLEKWGGLEGGRRYLLSDSRGIHSHLWQKRREPIYLTPPGLLLSASGGLWVRVVSPWACSTHTPPQPSARPWEQGSELSPLPWPETFPRIQNFRCPKPGVLGKPVTLVGSQTPPFSPRTNSTAWNLGQLLPISTFSVCPPRSMSVYLGLWLSFSPPLPNFCFSSQAS